MCLTASSQLLTAAKDIICFKHGEINGTTFEPPYNNFEYHKGQRTNRVPIKRGSYVYEGYHTYNNLVDAQNTTTRSVGIFIIPKGELYIEGYFNGRNNRVSASLLYFGSYKWWNIRQLKKKYGKNCLETL